MKIQLEYPFKNGNFIKFQESEWETLYVANNIYFDSNLRKSAVLEMADNI